MSNRSSHLSAPRRGGRALLAQSLSVIAFALAQLLAAPSAAQDPAAEIAAFVARVKSTDDQVRLASREEAVRLGARAIAPLALVIREGEGEPRTTARHALTRIVHSAGRPGAESERAPVLRELETVVLTSGHPYLRRECLWLIGFIGGDARSIEVAEKCLWDDDRHVAEIARLVLERMPGTIDTLTNAIRRAGDEQRADLIFSLAKKGDRAVAPFLLALLDARHPKVRFAALEGLARLGAPEGIAPLTAAVSDVDDPARSKLFNEYLRLADAAFEGPDGAQGRAMYEFALANAPEDFQRERALHRLAPEGDESSVDALLAGLGDSAERVRRLAILRLAVLRGASVGAALARGYERASPANRPILLRAIAERDAVGAKPLVDRAATSDEPELRITALGILGDLARPELEATYLEVAQTGSDAVRETALTGYLAVAEKRLESGEGAKALAMFRRSLELGTDSGLRSRALRGLIAVGDPAAIDSLDPFLADPVLALDAAGGYLELAAKLGAAGKIDDAERRAVRIATGNFPRDVISRAVDLLRALGRDPQRAARSQGFVLDWWLTGPIQDADGEGLAREFAPETKIDLEAVWRVGTRRFRWQQLRDISLDGRVNLLPIFRRSERVIAYAYTEIESSGEREVLFKTGSDDGMACWVEGERVLFVPAPRSLAVDTDTTRVKLRDGKTRVLIKVQQGGGDWGFALRITDTDGKPLDFNPR